MGNISEKCFEGPMGREQLLGKQSFVNKKGNTKLPSYRRTES